MIIFTYAKISSQREYKLNLSFNMANQISEYLNLTNDKYAPAIPKPLLNTRDNYQIYSLYSRTIKLTSSGQMQIKTSAIIAVQKYHLLKPLCDFDAIANQYK